MVPARPLGRNRQAGKTFSPLYKMSAGKDGDEKSREEHIDEIVRACGARRHPGDMDWMKEPKRSSRAKAKAKQKKKKRNHRRCLISTTNSAASDSS